MTASNRLSRLRWRCRRGMKELDVMLERFLERQATVLADGGWPEMETLLDVEDDRLWEWLRDPGADGAERYRNLLEDIRNDAH